MTEQKTSDKEKDTADMVSKRHHILLKQACALLHRNYNIICGFENYREESYTIFTAFALIIVCVLAYSSMYTAIDFLLVSYVKSNVTEELFGSINANKFVIPAFWMFVIYVIDLSILNQHRNGDEVKSDPSSLIDALKGGFIKYIPANPVVLFRVSLVLASAIISAFFVISKINEQLLRSHVIVETNKTKISITEKFDSDRGQVKSKIEEIQLREQIVKNDLERLNLDLKNVEVKRDRDMSNTNKNSARELADINEKIKTCTDEECNKLKARRDSLYAYRRSDRKSLVDEFNSDIKEINAKIIQNKSELESIKSELNKKINLLIQINVEKDSAIKLLESDAENYIDSQRSFGSLVKYMLSGDQAGRMVSIIIFSVICVFFIIIDASVLMMKYSRYSLYDRYMDRIDLNKGKEIDKME